METEYVDLENRVRFSPARECEFYSVELRTDDIKTPYQFRLWNDDFLPMFFIVKQNSLLLSRLKVGSTILMKYYSNNPQQQVRQYPTRIVDIVNEQTGRFKGHCKVQLAIVDVAAA